MNDKWGFEMQVPTHLLFVYSTTESELHQSRKERSNLSTYPNESSLSYSHSTTHGLQHFAWIGSGPWRLQASSRRSLTFYNPVRWTFRRGRTFKGMTNATSNRITANRTSATRPNTNLMHSFYAFFLIPFQWSLYLQISERKQLRGP